MNDGYELLNDDEVLFVDRGRVLMPNPTFKVSEFLDALAEAVHDSEEDWSEECERWFADGLECEALRFNSGGWQRGRVRIRLEFLPGRPQGRLPERSSAPRNAEPPLERPRPRNVETIYDNFEDDRY